MIVCWLQMYFDCEAPEPKIDHNDYTVYMVWQTYRRVRYLDIVTEIGIVFSPRLWQHIGNYETNYINTGRLFFGHIQKVGPFDPQVYLNGLQTKWIKLINWRDDAQSSY